MIIQFNTGDVTFFEEDQQYFEKRLQGITKYLGKHAGDEDSVRIEVKLSKDKHHSGDKFHGKLYMTSPHGGKFMAEADNEDIKGLADKLKKSLREQVIKFNETH
ncbi:hypothetical protein CSB37_00460 [bacterium DOLZORAL124_38_8]|nr:MAG: hypothetical protein CSB37_00460 [bacterium DOLZORAL124_38_8]